jgi:uncharacterized Zn-binding protein involved in type VI secretion
MPAITRKGDACTGHGGYPARPSTQGSSNVFINGIAVHRQTDAWASHCNSSGCHSSVLQQGSSSVYVNGLPVGRIGDPVACGSTVAVGSPNVFAGG